MQLRASNREKRTQNVKQLAFMEEDSVRSNVSTSTIGSDDSEYVYQEPTSSDSFDGDTEHEDYEDKDDDDKDDGIKGDRRRAVAPVDPKVFRTVFESIQRNGKFMLKTGKLVEDTLFQYGKRLAYEQ